MAALKCERRRWRTRELSNILSPFIGVLRDLTVMPGIQQNQLSLGPEMVDVGGVPFRIAFGIKKILPDSITKYDGLRIVCPRRGMGSANRSTLFCVQGRFLCGTVRTSHQ